MKTTIVFLAIALIAIMLSCEGVSGQDYCTDIQVHRCFQECKFIGHHSMCEAGECSCMSCYYRACKAKCAREGRVGQCQDEVCNCLG